MTSVSDSKGSDRVVRSLRHFMGNLKSLTTTKERKKEMVIKKNKKQNNYLESNGLVACAHCSHKTGVEIWFSPV